MNRSRHLTAALLVLSLLPQAAFASDAQCSLRLDEGWARLPPMEMPVLGGFGILVNPCGTDASVTGASSPDFEEVQVHETRHEDGMMRMRQVESLAVPATGSATLEPGGLHLMLMRPVRALESGDEVKVVFTLADGGTVPATLEVR